MVKTDLIIVGGKRKTSIAKAHIKEGKGIITINKVPYTTLHDFHRLSIEEPIRIAKSILGEIKYDIHVKVTGGGNESRIEASRLAIARALVKQSESNKQKLKDQGLLTRDPRDKERKKYGRKRARKRFQYSKR